MEKINEEISTDKPINTHEKFTGILKEKIKNENLKNKVLQFFDLNEESLKILEPAINQEFYTEKEDYVMSDDDLAMFFYIKLNEINFNYEEFFIKQEKITEKATIEPKEKNEKNKETQKKHEERKSIISDGSLRKGNIQKSIEDLPNQVQSKSNLILNKLKKISQLALISKDKESLDDLQWILKTMGENNLNEPEIKPHINESDPGEDFLSKYSRRESIKMMQLDFAKTKSRRSTFFNNSDNKSEFEIKTRRRESIITELISPSIFAKVAANLDLIETHEFDIFELDSLLQNRTLLSMATEIFSRRDFFDGFIDQEKFSNFIKEITRGYDRKIPYHNDLHAGDVFQTLNFMLMTSETKKNLELTDIDLISSLIAAICHDFKHNGYNNIYHTNTRSDIATTYNETFKVLKNEKLNIFENFSVEEYRTARRRIIELILHTDMEFHSSDLEILKNKVESFEIKKGLNLNKLIEKKDLIEVFDNQQQILGFALHAADISNPAKETKTCHKWRDLIFLEFFNQGDKEKSLNLKPSILCDRETTNMNSSQIYFISFIVKPSFDLLVNIFPEISPLIDYIKINLRYYQNICSQEKEKNKLN